MNIVKSFLNEGQYIKEATSKVQIVWHHTASGGTTQDVASYFNSTKERIATHYVIGRDGSILQLFDESYWAYHLGLKQDVFDDLDLNFLPLDKYSIGIEFISWGALTKRADGLYYNWVGKSITSNVIFYPYRDYSYYQKLTKEQLTSGSILTKQIAARHNIPLIFNEDIFDITPRALSKEPGLYMHTSYNPSKNDMPPYDELVDTLIKL